MPQPRRRAQWSEFAFVEGAQQRSGIVGIRKRSLDLFIRPQSHSLRHEPDDPHYTA